MKDVTESSMRRARIVCGAHSFTDEEDERVSAMRSAATVFMASIMDNCPSGADRQAAIRKVREALMTANSGVAMRGTDPTLD